MSDSFRNNEDAPALDDPCNVYREGYVRLYARHGDSYWIADPNDYGRLLAAWREGQAFAEYRNPFGELSTIKLIEVANIGLTTAASALLRAEYDAWLREREMLGGA